MSTHGTVFSSETESVNVCQRLSTHQYVVIIVTHSILDDVNNINLGMCVSYIPETCHDRKKTIHKDSLNLFMLLIDAIIIL